MKNQYVKFFGVSLIIIILGFSILNFIKGDDSKQVNKDDSVNPVNIVNGIQEVKLSWGKLNYNPEEIVVKKDIPVKITADMSRITGCYRSFNILGLGIYKYFKENDNTLEFTPEKAGNFRFSCSMGMGNGKFIVQ